MNIADLAITSLETITAFNLLTGDFMFEMDELQSASIAQGQEKTDINGKQGRKLTSMKRNKTVTISGTNGMLSCGMLELQTGSKFANKASTVKWVDYLTVQSDAAATNFKAVGTAGAEITNLYIKNTNGTVGDEFVQAAAVDTGKFTYDPATKALAFKADELADGTEIVVYYKRKIQADVLDNMSDQYSGKCTLYVDALGEDKCGNVYRIQIYIPKADFNGEFTFEMGDNQTVHNFEAEALAGSCGSGGQLWSYTVFGSTAADVA